MNNKCKNGKTILLQVLQSLGCKTTINVSVETLTENLGRLMKKTAVFLAPEILNRSAVEVG